MGTSVRQWFTRHVLLVDAVIAVVAGGSITWSAVGEAASRTPPAPVAWFGVAFAVLAGLGLVLRRRATLVAVAVTYGATLAFLLSGNPFGPVVQLAGLAMYAAGAWLTTRVSGVVCAVAVAGYLPLELVFRWTGAGIGATLLITAGWLVAPWLVGVGVRAFRRGQAAVAAADRREHVYQERLRIAREVHDVVGHSLAVISMQAGVALHVLEKQPEEAVAALRAIRGTSNDALGELRATLATLEAPGLAKLPALLASVSSPALAVELVVDGDARPLPADIDLAAYRIVQEALTNVVRHAAARHVTVHIGYRHDGIRLAVTDDGRGGETTPGRGLTGMADRAGAVGGTVTVKSTVDGCTVVAELPLADQ